MDVRYYTAIVIGQCSCMEKVLTHWSHDKVMLLMSIGLGLKVDAPSNDSWDTQQMADCLMNKEKKHLWEECKLWVITCTCPAWDTLCVQVKVPNASPSLALSMVHPKASIVFNVSLMAQRYASFSWNTGGTFI